MTIQFSENASDSIVTLVNLSAVLPIYLDDSYFPAPSLATQSDFLNAMDRITFGHDMIELWGDFERSGKISWAEYMKQTRRVRSTFLGITDNNRVKNLCRQSSKLTIQRHYTFNIIVGSTMMTLRVAAPNCEYNVKDFIASVYSVVRGLNRKGKVIESVRRDDFDKLVTSVKFGKTYKYEVELSAYQLSAYADKVQLASMKDLKNV